MCISLRVLDCWSSTILPGGWKSLSILTGDQILRPQWNQAVLGLFRSLTSFSPQGQRWELLVKRLQCSQCSQCNNVYYTILQNDPIWGIQQTTFSFTTFLQTAQDAWNRTGDWCNCFLHGWTLKKKQQQQPVQDLSDESQVVVTLVTSKNAWTNSFDPDILRNPAILPPMVRHVTAFDGSQSARPSKRDQKRWPHSLRTGSATQDSTWALARSKCGKFQYGRVSCSSPVAVCPLSAKQQKRHHQKLLRETFSSTISKPLDDLQNWDSIK